MRYFFLLCLFLIAPMTNAASSFFVVLSGGYASNEQSDVDVDGMAFKVGIGYQYSPQWDFEFGFQRFGEENGGDIPTSEDDPSAEYNGVYVSALGKAQGQSGVLFYRIGINYIDAEAIDIQTSGDCPSPFDSNVSVTPSLCQFDESILAAHIGLGFDVELSPNFSLRTEAEWTKGENDFESLGGYIGLRYVF